jgi:phosphoglycolate phosphatase-like HAD superfamily hydrolase
MANEDHDAFADRGRALEEEYFRKKDKELVEKMQQAARREQARRDMSDKTGLQDPELLEELQALGFTPEMVALLPLVPVVQVAWAEGFVMSAERALVVKLARARGIGDDSPADRLLSEWLETQPDPDVFARATRLIRAMLAAEPRAGASVATTETGSRLGADDLVGYCEAVAAASGGILGLKRISNDERAVIESIAAELKAR